MKNPKTQATLYLFIILACIELYAEFIHHSEMMFLIKPTLLPLLMLYYVFSVKGDWNKTHKLMIWAIFFSWVGDVALVLTPDSPTDLEVLGVPKNQNFFFGGVGGFLISHLFFIAAYLQDKATETKSLFEQKKWPFALVAIYIVAIISIIAPRVYAHPEKSAATIPVIIYALVIGSMVVFALNRYAKVNAKSFRMVLIGSIIFLISDSMIAINFLAFEGSIPRAGFWIMITFLAAEYLIAEGVLESRYEKE